jgi:hypothetical protein
MARRPLDLIAGVEHEIRGEKASSLGRMGDRLEATLLELAELGRALDAEADAETRAARLEDFNDCRERARQTLYWLCVQREAMGVTDHREILKVYPIPPRRRR